jgi:hypothetical protein
MKNSVAECQSIQIEISSILTKTHDLSNSLKKPTPLPGGAVAPGRRGSHQKYRKQPHAK